MVLGLDFDQEESCQRAFSRSNRWLASCSTSRAACCCRCSRGNWREIDFDPMGSAKGVDELDRSLTLHRERRSKCLMAATDGIDRASEGCFVEASHLP